MKFLEIMLIMILFSALFGCGNTANDIAPTPTASPAENTEKPVQGTEAEKEKIIIEEEAETVFMAYIYNESKDDYLNMSESQKADYDVNVFGKKEILDTEAEPVGYIYDYDYNGVSRYAITLCDDYACEVVESSAVSNPYAEDGSCVYTGFKGYWYLEGENLRHAITKEVIGKEEMKAYTLDLESLLSYEDSGMNDRNYLLDYQKYGEAGESVDAVTATIKAFYYYINGGFDKYRNDSPYADLTTSEIVAAFAGETDIPSFVESYSQENLNASYTTNELEEFSDLKRAIDTNLPCILVYEYAPFQDGGAMIYGYVLNGESKQAVINDTTQTDEEHATYLSFGSWGKGNAYSLIIDQR